AGDLVRARPPRQPPAPAGGVGPGPPVRAWHLAARHVHAGRARRAHQHVRRLRPAPALPGRACCEAGAGHGRGGRRRGGEVPRPVRRGDRGAGRRRPGRVGPRRSVHSGQTTATVTSEAFLPITPPLARSGLRRMAHRRTDEAWLTEAWDRAKVLVVDRGTALARGQRLMLLPTADAPLVPAGERIFLGEDVDGTPYFAVLAEIEDRTDTTPPTL